MRTEEIPPNADALIESIRSTGYDLGMSVADIIDNSITAKASIIKITDEWDGENSSISIFDNGTGMSENELREAMRLGTKNPIDDRNSEDLGRFGLGLKTASFAQCRNLEVISKKASCDVPHSRCWDLDYVRETKKWDILILDPQDNEEHRAYFDDNTSGTIVRWSYMDRIVGGMKNNKSDYKKYLHLIADLRDYIGMIFHKYLSEGAVEIWVNSDKIEPWNPFYENHPSSQCIADEDLKFDHDYSVKVHILPHASKVETDTYKKMAGFRGWNNHQGYYVYRNNRLIVFGTWFNLVRRTDPHQLARIELHISNKSDHLWALDIKKSSVNPPQSIRRKLKIIAKKACAESKKVYQQRSTFKRKARVSIDKQRRNIWIRSESANTNYFKINREHLIIKEYIANPEKGISVENILRVIENTVPVILIAQDNPTAENYEVRDFRDSKQFFAMLEITYKYHKSKNKKIEAIRLELLKTEPYNSYPNFVDEFIRRKIKDEN